MSCRKTVRRRHPPREAITQAMGIFAHHQVVTSATGSPSAGRIVRTLIGTSEFVADTADVDRDLRRLFSTSVPAMRPIIRGPLRTLKPRVAMLPRPWPPWAWQMAQASASGGVGRGCPGRLNRRDHLLYLLLGRLTVADHRLLHLQRRVFRPPAVRRRPTPRSPRRAPGRAAASTAD